MTNEQKVRDDWEEGTRQCIQANIDGGFNVVDNIMKHVKTLVNFEVKESQREMIDKMPRPTKEEMEDINKMVVFFFDKFEPWREDLIKSSANKYLKGEKE